MSSGYESMLRRAQARLRHREAGATLVEFALICLLFLAVLFGIAAFGHALYAYHFVSHAAREAARFAIVNGSACNNDAGGANPGSCTAPVTCSAGACAICTSGCGPASTGDIKNYVRMIAPPGIDPDPAKLVTTPSWLTTGPGKCATNSHAPGCTVQVQVSYNFSFLFPLVRSRPLTVSSTSQMVIAH